MAYAEGTEVPIERSRAEIERLLTRYGADQFYSGWESTRALIGFRAKGRMIRFVLVIPAKDDRRFQRDGRGAVRSPKSRETAWEKECRRLWRALALLIKAQLEAVESRILTFEEAFLAHTLLPNGSTVAEWTMPQLTEVYASGRMPKALPGIGETGGEETHG
jgi:hypothetical protein